MAKKRMDFIRSLREMITRNLVEQGLSEDTIFAAFEQWDRGFEPRTPVERGCFQVFEQIEREVTKTD